MRAGATTFCLWIAAIALAVSVGGNLFQAIVIDPVWSASPPESVRAFAVSPYLARLKMFHTNPLFLFGLVCLLASPFLAWNRPPIRIWLLIAAGCYFAVLLSTLFYFYPINDVLFGPAGVGTDAATVRTMTRNWLLADRVRYVLRLAAFLCVLRAMAVR